MPERLPSGGTQSEGRLLGIAALGLHQRDEFACDEGEGDEQGGQNDARDGEDDLDILGIEPGPQKSLGSEHHHIDQPGDHG